MIIFISAGLTYHIRTWTEGRNEKLRWGRDRVKENAWVKVKAPVRNVTTVQMFFISPATPVNKSSYNS